MSTERHQQLRTAFVFPGRVGPDAAKKGKPFDRAWHWCLVRAVPARVAGTVGRRDSGRRAYREVFTACRGGSCRYGPHRECLTDLGCRRPQRLRASSLQGDIHGVPRRPVPLRTPPRMLHGCRARAAAPNWPSQGPGRGVGFAPSSEADDRRVVCRHRLHGDVRAALDDALDEVIHG